MKIAFFSEARFNGKVTSDQIGRTDINWYHALDAVHINIYEYDYSWAGKFDLGIYIIPKNNPMLGEDVIQKMSAICSKIAVMQEANHDNFQDNDVETQIDYINFLNHVDVIFCHNEIDLKYYKGIYPNKHIFINPTLMLVDNLENDKITMRHQREGVMIGGNFGKWYNGLDSFMMASLFDEPLFAPSMGRKTRDEDHIDNITHIPYKDWNNWMYDLSKCKYAVHLMRTYAAGSFSLNCAYLKIPCVGWNSIDTQRILYPELSFDEGDMQAVRKKIKHLKENEQFANHVVEYAFKAYVDTYSKEQYLKTFKENYAKILS